MYCPVSMDESVKVFMTNFHVVMLLFHWYSVSISRKGKVIQVAPDASQTSLLKRSQLLSYEKHLLRSSAMGTTSHL